jgi:hypothetical protein
MRGERPAVAGDNAVLLVDQHRVGEAKFADRSGDLRDLLVAVRARVSGVGDQRWSVYRRYTGGQLVAITHEPGSPWDVTWRQANRAPDARIDKGLIRAWFKEKADQSRTRNVS